MDYDKSFLEPEAGQRALWLLYRYGGWGYLEDLGMDRAVAEPVFARFDAENVVGKRLTRTQCRMLDAENVVGKRLTRTQCRMLEKLVPGFKEARVELQLAYALRYYEEEKDKDEALHKRGKNGTRWRLRLKRSNHRTAAGGEDHEVGRNNHSGTNAR